MSILQAARPSTHKLTTTNHYHDGSPNPGCDRLFFKRLPAELKPKNPILLWPILQADENRLPATGGHEEQKKGVVAGPFSYKGVALDRSPEHGWAVSPAGPRIVKFTGTGRLIHLSVVFTTRSLTVTFPAPMITARATPATPYNKTQPLAVVYSVGRRCLR